MVKHRALFVRRGVATGDSQAEIGPDPFRAWWNWNGRSLRLETDRFGLQPVFYRHSGDFFAVSSSIDMLRQQGDDFDWCALGLFFRLSFFLDNDTPFREIHLAPADSILLWEDGKLSIDTRTRPPVRSYAGSRQSAMDTYIGIFREQFRALVEGYSGVTISCPLSGGRDSRHIFLELIKMGVPFRSFTVDLDNADDAPIAAALCAQYKAPHTIVPMEEHSLKVAREMNAATHYATIEHRWMTGMVKAIPPGIVFDGVAGDVLSAGHFATEKLLSQFRRGALEELAEDLLVEEEGLRALLQPWLYAKLNREEAKHRLVGALIRHVDAPSPIASFFLANRTRRVASLMATTVFGHCLGLMPFFLDPVYDFLFTLPGEMTVDFQLHSDVLAQEFPECRHPYSKKHAPATARRFMAEALTVSSQWSGIANMSFLVPRLLRGSVDGAYSGGGSWLVAIPQYLHQIGVEAG